MKSVSYKEGLYEMLRDDPDTGGNPDKLTETENDILELAFGYSPDLKEAYQLRNAMTDIFEEDYTKQEAITAFKEWEEKVMQSGLDCYDSFIKTLNSFPKLSQ